MRVDLDDGQEGNQFSDVDGQLSFLGLWGRRYIADFPTRAIESRRLSWWDARRSEGFLSTLLKVLDLSANWLNGC